MRTSSVDMVRCAVLTLAPGGMVPFADAAPEVVSGACIDTPPIEMSSILMSCLWLEFLRDAESDPDGLAVSSPWLPQPNIDVDLALNLATSREL